MKSRFFLIIMIILSVIMTLSNLFGIITSPIHSLINIVLLAGVISCAILYGEQKQKEKYDYDQENPNALISGRNVAGTVYASYPGNSPGLGWIL